VTGRCYQTASYDKKSINYYYETYLILGEMSVSVGYISPPSPPPILKGSVEPTKRSKIVINTKIITAYSKSTHASTLDAHCHMRGTYIQTLKFLTF
jgi:hypothetical protein